MIHAGVTPGYLQRRQSKRKPALEPVQEHHIHMTPAGGASVRYRPHKYGTEAVREGPRQCVCVRPLSVLGKLRDRYVKAMNEMARGDFTAVAGVHLVDDFSTLSLSRRAALPPSSQVHPS